MGANPNNIWIVVPNNPNQVACEQLSARCYTPYLNLDLDPPGAFNLKSREHCDLCSEEWRKPFNYRRVPHSDPFIPCFHQVNDFLIESLVQVDSRIH